MWNQGEKKASVVSSNGDMLASYPSLGVWEVKDEEKKRGTKPKQSTFNSNRDNMVIPFYDRKQAVIRATSSLA